MNSIIVLFFQKHMTGITATSKAEFCTCFVERCHVKTPCLSQFTLSEVKPSSPLQSEAAMGRGSRLHTAELKLMLNPFTPSASPGLQSGYISNMHL